MDFLAEPQVSLGPLTLQTHTFLLVLSALLAGALVFFRYRDQRGLRRIFFDNLSTAALLALLGWKLYPLWDSFGEMIRNPLTLLYTPGGTPGLWVGLGVAALYLGVKVALGRERRTSERGLLGPTVLFGLSFAGATGLLLGLSVAARAARVEQPATPFSAQTVAGQTVSLEALRGKTVIVNFWATWCPPCRAELPTLVAFDRQIAGSETVLLGVAVGPTQTAAALRPFMAREKIGYPVLLDPERRIAARYGVRTLPTTVVISPRGTVSERRVGPVDLHWLRAQVQSHPPAAAAPAP